MKRINLLITVVALGIISVLGFQYFQKLPPQPKAIQYENTKYGYRFTVPEEYTLKENAPELATISKREGGIVAIIATVPFTKAATGSTFTELSHAAVLANFCDEDASSSVECTKLARTVQLSTKSGIPGELFTVIKEQTETGSTTATTTSSEIGPFLVFDISPGNQNAKYTALIMRIETPESTDAGLIEQLAETLAFIGAPATTTATTTGNGAQSIELQAKIDQGASGLDVKIVPLKVLEDSRCPVDVQCIQAGTVRLSALLMSGMGTATTTFQLGKTITTEAEAVTLTNVLPAPHAGEEITAKDYRFTFTVKKR